MKTKILLSLIAISSFACIAQNNNPYDAFGYKPKVEYKEKERELYTVINSDKCAEIQKLSFDFTNKKIYALSSDEAIIKVIPISDDMMARWLSVDPLTKSYPQLTPYQFAENKPIQYVDLDGKEAGWRDPETGIIYARSSSIPEKLPNGAFSNIGVRPDAKLNYVAKTAADILGGVGVALNTFISGYNDNGTKAGIADYVKAGGDIFTFGALVGGTEEGGIGKGEVGVPKTYERVMSFDELNATTTNGETGILRGGKMDPPENFFTDKTSSNSSSEIGASLGLDHLPAVKVKFEITDPNIPVYGPTPGGAKPGKLGNGGGTEFNTTQPTPIKIHEVTPLKD